ncbi:hypothetical protein TSAR_016129, partial [Trichomalopsis sarcophagae]
KKVSNEIIKDRLYSQSDLPKVLAKKSIQDEEEIQAAEAYEFEYIPESSPDYGSSQSLEIEPLASASHDDHHDHHPKVGYSVGGPLVTIAQGAAQQAHNFEKNQPAAAAQAAYVAKNRLGQSAGLSAATAAAAFAGKQIIYRGLEQQAYNAHRALESEKLQLQVAQRAATAAAHAAQQAMHQVQVITTALNAAQATSEHASAAASAAAGELAAQTAMVGAAKARLQAIEDQLHHARIDFEAARAANFKAAHAAQVAQNNAAAAAAHAAEVANAIHHHHDHGHGHHHHHDHGHKHHGHHHHDHHDHHHHHHHEHHSGKLQQADDDDEDHDHNESVAIPISKSGSSGLGSTLSSSTGIERLEVTTVVPGDRDTDRNGRAQHTVPTEHSAPLATVASISKDELYDAYDSYPY